MPYTFEGMPSPEGQKGPPDPYASLADQYSRQYGVRPELVRAVIAQESGWKPTAESEKGAQGLMQLMPKTAAERGVSNPFDPEQNIRGGVEHLSRLLKQYGGDEQRALAAYYTGEGTVATRGITPAGRRYAAEVSDRAANEPARGEYNFTGMPGVPSAAPTAGGYNFAGMPAAREPVRPPGLSIGPKPSELPGAPYPLAGAPYPPARQPAPQPGVMDYVRTALFAPMGPVNEPLANITVRPMAVGGAKAAKGAAGLASQMEMVGGLPQLKPGADINKALNDASDVMEGVGMAMTPVAVAAAIFDLPGTLVAVVGSYLAAKATGDLSRFANASPELTRFLENAAATIAAAGGAQRVARAAIQSGKTAAQVAVLVGNIEASARTGGAPVGIGRQFPSVFNPEPAAQPAPVVQVVSPESPTGRYPVTGWESVARGAAPQEVPPALRPLEAAVDKYTLEAQRRAVEQQVGPEKVPWEQAPEPPAEPPGPPPAAAGALKPAPGAPEGVNAWGGVATGRPAPPSVYAGRPAYWTPEEGGERADTLSGRPAIEAIPGPTREGPVRTPPTTGELDQWKQEQVSMGYSEQEVDTAISQSLAQGINPIDSDDLDDLDAYWQGLEAMRGEEGVPEDAYFNVRSMTTFRGEKSDQQARLVALDRKAGRPFRDDPAFSNLLTADPDTISMADLRAAEARLTAEQTRVQNVRENIRAGPEDREASLAILDEAQAAAEAKPGYKSAYEETAETMSMAALDAEIRDLTLEAKGQSRFSPEVVEEWKASRRQLGLTDQEIEAEALEDRMHRAAAARENLAIVRRVRAAKFGGPVTVIRGGVPAGRATEPGPFVRPRGPQPARRQTVDDLWNALTAEEQGRVRTILRNIPPETMDVLSGGESTFTRPVMREGRLDFVKDTWAKFLGDIARGRGANWEGLGLSEIVTEVAKRGGPTQHFTVSARPEGTRPGGFNIQKVTGRTRFTYDPVTDQFLIGTENTPRHAEDWAKAGNAPSTFDRTIRGYFFPPHGLAKEGHVVLDRETNVGPERADAYLRLVEALLKSGATGRTAFEGFQNIPGWMERIEGPNRYTLAAITPELVANAGRRFAVSAKADPELRFKQQLQRRIELIDRKLGHPFGDRDDFANLLATAPEDLTIEDLQAAWEQLVDLLDGRPYYRGTPAGERGLKTSTGHEHGVEGISTTRTPEEAAMHGGKVQAYYGKRGRFIDYFDLVAEWEAHTGKSVDAGDLFNDEELAAIGRQLGYIGSVLKDPQGVTDYRFFDADSLIPVRDIDQAPTVKLTRGQRVDYWMRNQPAPGAMLPRPKEWHTETGEEPKTPVEWATHFIDLMGSEKDAVGWVLENIATELERVRQYPEEDKALNWWKDIAQALRDQTGPRWKRITDALAKEKALMEGPPANRLLFRAAAQQGDTFSFKGRPAWVGAANRLDGVIEEVHTFDEARAANFHHQQYFSPAVIERLESGEAVVFTQDQPGLIELFDIVPPPTDATTTPDLEWKIAEQIQPFYKAGAHGNPIPPRPEEGIAPAEGGGPPESTQDVRQRGGGAGTASPGRITVVTLRNGVDVAFPRNLDPRIRAVVTNIAKSGVFPRGWTVGVVPTGLVFVSPNGYILRGYIAPNDALPEVTVENIRRLPRMAESVFAEFKKMAPPDTTNFGLHGIDGVFPMPTNAVEFAALPDPVLARIARNIQCDGFYDDANDTIVLTERAAYEASNWIHEIGHRGIRLMFPIERVQEGVPTPESEEVQLRAGWLPRAEIWQRAPAPSTQRRGPVPRSLSFSVSSYAGSKWRQEFSSIAARRGFPRAVGDYAINLIDAVVEIFKAHPDLLPQEGGKKPAKNVRGWEWIRALVPNADFKWTFDVDRTCKRVIQFWATRNAIQKRLGRPMSEDELLHLGQQMLLDGDIPGCIFCYVEASRRAAARNAYALATKTGPEILEEVRETKKKDSKLPIYAARRDALLKKSGISLGDFARMMADGEIFDDWLKTGGVKKELAELGRDYVRSAKGTALTGVGTYMHEILNWTPDQVRDTNERAGLRSLSATDLDPTQLVDTLEMLADATVRRLAGHMYTKEPYAVTILAPGGMKVNMSVALNGTPGQYTQDTANGMPFDIALRLRQRYPNAGTMLVAKNLDQIRFGLDSPDIDMMIPHHAANWTGGPKKYGIYGLDDFSHVQHEWWVNEDKAPKTPAIDKDTKKVKRDEHGKIVMRAKTPIEVFGNKLYFAYWLRRSDWNPRAAAEAYVRFCRAHNLHPKFDKGPYKSGQSQQTEEFPGFADHPNYWKLISDYARVTSPQQPLDITKIDKDELGAYLEKYIGEGGWQERRKPNPATVERFLRAVKTGDVINLDTLRKTQELLDRRTIPLRSVETPASLGISKWPVRTAKTAQLGARNPARLVQDILGPIKQSKERR